MLGITDLTCRVCLQEQEILINIFDELEDLNTNLSILLQTCVEMQIHEEDAFPKYLCEDCTRELLITSKFRDKCEKSKEILSEILMNNMSVKETEELSNHSDIIEYGSEDEDDVEVNEICGHDEHHVVANDTEPVDQVVSLSLLKKPSSEHIKSDEVSYQPLIEIVKEEAILTEDCGIVLQLDVQDSPEINEGSAAKDSTHSLFLDKAAIETSRLANIFKCDVCGALFKQAMNLQKHLQKSHDTDYCFVCNKCNHCFSLEIEFKSHVENCTFFKTSSEKNAGNQVAGADYTIPETLDTTRKCIYCERTFSTPFALRMHLRTHTGERPFQCKFCTKSFKTQSQLNVHHKRHIGQADFICTICNKSFYEQSNLSVHMRSHTGEKPHVCSICNKAFARVFLLQFHMRTHTGEKPFKCNICDKNFRQQTDLRNHLTMHTGKKQHNCILCGKSYTKKSHLVQHMSKQHGQYNTLDSEETSNLEQDHLLIENSEISYSFNDIIQNDDIDTQSNEI